MKRITFILALITILASCETPSKEKQALYKSFNSELEKTSKQQPLPEEYQPLEISGRNDYNIFIELCYRASDAKHQVKNDAEYQRVKQDLIKNGKILGFENKTINRVLTELDLETYNFDVWLKSDSRYK
jgi:hypothetical protein